MRWSAGLAAAVLGLAAVGASGQVVPTQSGRLLDRNYLIGSGGLNSIRRTDRFIDGNLLITGQVTRGVEFRGGAPYAGANQLRLEVPSAGLDSFIRRSSSLTDLTSGGDLYRPSPYLSAQRTVLGPTEISRGQTQAGTLAPWSAYGPPPEQRRLIDSAVEAYKPILPELSRRLRLDSRLEPLVDASPEGRLRALGRASESDAGAVRPTASALFGILRPQETADEAEEPTEDERTRQQRRVGEPVEARVEPAVPAPGPLTGREPPAERPQPQEPAPRELPEQGQDVFVDILVALQWLRQAEQAGPQPPEQQQPPRRPVEKPRPDETPEQAQQRILRERARAAVERVRGKLVVRRLAGESKDLVNVHLTRGDRLLGEGKYYEAAGRYELANIITRSTNPRDPRPPLGAALAFFAADEPLTASFYVEQAMKRFPPLMMEIDVDVNRLLGPEVVSRRVAQIEGRIAEAGEEADPSLVLLAAFIRSAAGQRDRAVEHARLLKKLAAANEVLKAYAECLLTGKRPAAAPASAPAKGR